MTKTFWNVVKIAALVCVLTLFAGATTTRGQAQAPASAANALARDIFKQLIEINTTDSVGNVTTAAEAMATRLREAGYAEKDLVLAGPNERKKNLVVRLRGTGKRKPVLFIGHLDVVEARREDWTTDPFQFVEKDGYFYGRGTNDMKAGDALLVTNFIRLKKEGYVPDRDLILALTADEEGGNFNGVEWLLKEHRDWVDAEYCINLDGGEFMKDNGKRLMAAMQGSEKVYADFQFESLNAGGHSSEPVRDNAIYHLAGALERLRDFDFPVRVNEITRNFFAQTAEISPGDSAADLKAVAQEPPDEAAATRLSRRAVLQHAAAHYLRGHHAFWRACAQRVAANSARQCELPDFSGRKSRGSAQDAGARGGGSEGECDAGGANWSRRKSHSSGDGATFRAAA